MEWLDHEFWRRVKTGPIDGCWEHTNKGDRRWGHVQVGPKGARGYAHRIAYTIANGPIPHGLVVMHACDNPPCCNPTHLKVGTQSDNNKDRITKGRTAVGEQVGSSKLTVQQVIEARAAVASGHAIRAVARALGVTNTTIFKIIHGTTWRSVPHAAREAQKEAAE